MAKQKTVWEARDGQTFPSMREADHHEAMLDLQEWYEDNKLYGRYEGSVVEWEDLIDWLKTNKNEVKTILNCGEVTG